MSGRASIKQGARILSVIAEMDPEPTIDEVQGLIANSDILQILIKAGEAKLRQVDCDKLRELLSVRRILENPYANEKTSTDRDYPSGYRPKVPVTQLRTLKKLYPQLDASEVTGIVENLGALREGEELFQVVPKLSAIAHLHGIEDPYCTGYGQCLEVMFSHVAKAFSSFENYRKDRLSDKYVRLLAETREYLEKLEEATSGDYLVIPMQSGKLWRGFSVRNARIDIENVDQWSLPAWVVGHHLLTHPKRLPAESYLNIDCPGDEYSPGADGWLARSLCFRFWGDGLRFGYYWTDDVLDYFGSASGSRREK
jgi:hypothetical protein